jgi:polyferredoxin
MKPEGKKINRIVVVFLFGLVPAVASQFFTDEPESRYIHVRNFRYGKDPSVIRCNRGDTLHLTFSSDDTGHSFFLQEFDIDAKVSPASHEVLVFKTSDPTEKPYLTDEVVITAEHQGVLKYLVSKSQYRCHVWCGPMHAFEQGKLVIMPNTLLIFSLGSLAAIVLLWISGFFRKTVNDYGLQNDKTGMKDLLARSGFFGKVLISRWFQVSVTVFTLVLIYIVLMTTLFGTKMSGRNLGILMMWAVWLFILVAALTPFGGRIWCAVCPLPFLGDWLQRRSFFYPRSGRTGEYNNKFYGLFLKWPDWLSNSWLKLAVFMILATFSTTLVAQPFASGMAILLLIILPSIMAMIWGLRAFCRYICPVTVFVEPFSGMSMTALRNKSQAVCDRCKPHFCQKGNVNGWACPYGLNVRDIKESNDCGLCLECLRSCSYDNVTIYGRPFGSEYHIRDISEAWLAIAIFVTSIIYSILYLGHWPAVRDYVNILDKKNWDLFGIYSLTVGLISLVIIPGIIFLLSYAGTRLAKVSVGPKEAFLNGVGSLLPLGLMLWIAFVIPMLFTNVTFILQSFSDPFGWGWDFFGTANMAWRQFLPQVVPWLQAILILAGLSVSLRNLGRSWNRYDIESWQKLTVCFPQSLFLVGTGLLMLFFHTN